MPAGDQGDRQPGGSVGLGRGSSNTVMLCCPVTTFRSPSVPGSLAGDHHVAVELLLG